MNATISTIQSIKMKFPLELGVQYYHFLEVRGRISKLKQKCQQRNEDLCTRGVLYHLSSIAPPTNLITRDTKTHYTFFYF